MKLDIVVVGLDFTAPSLDAVSWASRVFAPEARLVLVHSISVPEPPSFFKGRFPSSEELVASARRGAEERIGETVEQLGLDGAVVEIREGLPAEQLERVASEYGADLIVVGPHAERPGVWRLIGGTAQRVARHAPCPVLVARGLSGSRPSRILVPLDESELMAAVLDHAISLAREFGARLMVMHVIADSLLGATRIGATEREQKDAAHRLRESAEEWLRERLAAAGVPAADVDVVVRAGDAAHEILATAQEWDAELIVMGRSGSGRVGELILGSVANSVLRNGSGPLLLIGTP